MGERQFLIEYIQKLLQKYANGAGSAVRVPYDEASDKQLNVVIREGQLELNAWLAPINGARNDAELVRRVRQTVEADISSVKADDLARYYLIFDNAKLVTKAKADTQQKRDDREHKAGKEAYTEDELNAFFDVNAVGEHDDAALTKNETPDMGRLRISKGAAKRACMERMSQFFLASIFCEPFSRSFQLYFVARGQEFMVPHEAGKGFDVENSEEKQAPANIAEAEMLCVHYAFQMAREAHDLIKSSETWGDLFVSILCADTDAFMVGLLSVPRLSYTDCDDLPHLWLDLTPASKRRQLSSDSVESVKMKYNYAIDLCATYTLFMTKVVPNEPLMKRFGRHVLEVMELVGSLGGSDKVEKRDLCSSEILFKVLHDPTKNKIRPLLSENETVLVEPVQKDGTCADRLAQRRRVVVNELAMCDFALRAYASAKFSPIFASIENVLDSAETSDEVFKEVLEMMADSEQKAYEAKMKRYPKDKEKRARDIAKYKKENLEGVEEDSKKYKALAKKIPKPLDEPKRNYQPHASPAELRGLVRRCVYQLTETLNAIVPDGVPKAQAVDDKDGCLWGWKSNGERTDEIVPWTPQLDLFATC